MKNQFVKPRLAQRNTAHRRGAIFHYYMMYLFLSAVLMSSAGLCLHAILKADQADARVAIYLKTLARFDDAFRTDVSDHTVDAIQPGLLTLNTEAGDAVRWAIQDNIVKQESLEDATVTASNRFVFPNGTKLTFAEDGAFIVCRLQEASSMPAGYEPAPSQAKVVEIFATAMVEPAEDLTSAAEQTTESADESSDSDSDKDTTSDSLLPSDKQEDES